MTASVMLLALLIEVAVGWPDRLARAIGHPVIWMGAQIDRLDRRRNHPEDDRETRRRAGVRAALTAIATAVALAVLALMVLPGGPVGAFGAAVLAWPLIAARSLHDHVAPVAAALEAGDIPAARAAVARIVGRDVSALDEAGIARAALESLAENASDGVSAPLFWGLVAGLPGIAAYKAINTLDSMIGHRTERHEAFGRFSARLDDLVNWIPARLTGASFAVVSGRPARPMAVMKRDAPRHRSPNGGWPEAAMAAALGVRLSGPRIYGRHIADEPWLNPRSPDPTAADLRRGLALYRRAVWLWAGALALLAVLS